MNPVEAYLTELRDIRASGAAVPETSGYGALANLLNEVGGKLKPKVRCLINLQNAGAGIPDGGLFTASQFPKGAHGAEPLSGQLPLRGALEVKPVGDGVHAVAASGQVARYLEKYRQVLVTTYREFVLVGFNAEGEAASLESFSLAASEAEFWALAAHPGSGAARQAGERLTDFLRRVLLRQAQIAAPKDLAWLLASYAREARARAEERDLPNWVSTRKALEEALGMSFSGEKGEHFFRSTLVQTLFYGLFAAWVFWAEHHPPADAQARFRWREAAGYLHIPILQKLFYDFSNPGALGIMRIDEVLDWAAEALNRVDRASFFTTFEQSHAVQYFYEPFLEAFDPELRKELGVWYTPPEIVRYMVARVDTVLREELGIPDGLADPRVVVLDPCCGTGAYLVEVLNRIAATLAEKSGGVDALAAHEIKQAAMSRVYGFEILPAPFVISHLQIGMLLHRLGAPFADESPERAGVYLTNALTGWEPPTEPKQHLLFTEMEEERDKAQAVKQHAPILVILGNPPYNGFAGAAVDEERDLVTAYRTVKKVAPPQGQGLNDLYVRFFRMAERRITEGPEGKGIVCFISNYSWLDGLSFTGMRERFLEVFDNIWIDCLNGDKYKTGKVTPEGLPDPSVFSTEVNREGIGIGTAVGMLVRSGEGNDNSSIRFRDHWGRGKLAEMAVLAGEPNRNSWSTLSPSSALGLPLAPSRVAAGYGVWPRLTELLPMAFNGVMTSRDIDLVAIDRDALERVMDAYFDESVVDADLARTAPSLMTRTAHFDPYSVRRVLLQLGKATGVVFRYAYRPFDLRWVFWHPETDLIDRKREDLVAAFRQGCTFLTSRQKGERDREGSPFYVTRGLPDRHLTRPGSACFPLEMPVGDSQELFSSRKDVGGLNLSPEVISYLDRFDIAPGSDAPTGTAWLHSLAVGSSAGYLRENAGALHQDWPRIPLPATRDALLASAELGRRIAALLDVEEPVDAVTTGSVRHELRPLGVLTSVSGGQLDPSAGDLAVTTGWGHAGKGGVTMPGRGRAVERPYTGSELAAFREGLADLGLSYDQLTAFLGGACYDVYLNDVASWRCVPARVWKYTIGGYQVMKKWLSYRERALLGRDLKPDEARYVTEMTRRIAAIVLLEPALDANYERVKADTYAWPGGS
ncbi:MAG: type ISP restriction/modification enzyme [Thermoleophilia bacterium]